MAKKVSLGEGWDFLTDLKWQAKLFAYDAQYGVSDGYLTIKEAEKADKEFHEIMDKWIPKVEAEICLAEIEMDNAPDIKEYDSILNGNAFRKGCNRKARQNGKRNADKAKRFHKADRYHGKGLESYPYKEDGVIKESIEQVWHRCHMPVLDRIRHKSALKADAREQDFFLNPSVSEMEIEQKEKRMTEEEERILDNHYMVEDALSNFLKEGKYISLLSYWNGEYWEDSDSESNQFCGIKTAEEVKDAILAEQAKHLDLSKIEMDTVHEMTGVSFKWDGFHDWDDEKIGYVKLTFLPL